MIKMRFGERLSVVNLVSPLGAGTLVILEAASHGTSLWKEIRKEWLVFSQNAVFALGDGRRINFWSDVWCGVEALCNRFPNLFNIATNKEAKVADIWESREGNGCWSPTFLRSLNDWELEKMTSFLQILHDRS